MRLSKEDADLFYKLNWSLLFYVNKKFSNPELIDSFISENPFNFNQEELEIIESWKNFVKGDFFIVTHLKNYSVLLKQDEPKAYGVVGLIDEIEDIIDPYLPFQPHNIRFGSGIKKGIQAEYQAAKSKFGIILSLDAPISEKKESDEELLRFYVKSESNREENFISKIKGKDDEKEIEMNTKDPLSHFSRDNIERLHKIQCKEEDFSGLKEDDFEPEIDDDNFESEEKENKPKKEKIGRNDPCPCGSGKKYKKCCMSKEK